ncbi:hypothetical protein PSEUDO8Z_160170 [Pseudomonas sp. 8Z]|uniref:hypothetical protein n=1 Tax=Pseudomonas sp. 8Z TaxID=2653166 RepID=UPI0012F3EC50|nr:hypothetical protein [Pseudomonas sp. 8Z]VXC68344.1 hypothetical protein PSEUDO8Z_160170 [Pseudomonas sp. 8Z]
MSLPADINDRYVAAAEKAESGSEIIRRFANDPAGTLIPTESGPLPSLAEFLAQHGDALGNVPQLQTDVEGLKLYQQDLESEVDPLKGAYVLGRSVLWFRDVSVARAVPGRYDGDTAMLASYSVNTYGVGGGQLVWDATSNIGDNNGTVFQVTGVPVGRWVRLYRDHFIDGEQFGIVANGQDYANALEDAVGEASLAVSGAQGMRINLPRGKIGISRKIVQPNRVAIHGANGRGTIIQALDGFVDDCMIDGNNGTSSMFGSRLVDLWLDMRAQGGPDGRCIYTVAMQETCGLERVLLMNFNKYGMEYSSGYGGAAYVPLKDVEIFAGGMGTTPAAGIRINQVSLVGGFVLSVDGATIAGSPPGAATPYQLPVGISLVNDTFVGRGLHFEACADCVVSSGAGSVSIDTITGSSNGVVGSLVTLGSTWTGTLNVRNSLTNGAANHVKNNANGSVIPASAGMQPQITYPDKGQSAALGWVVFDASSIAVGAQCTIISKSSNIGGVLKTAVGRFTVQWAYSMPAGKSRSVGGGITNLNNTDPIKVVHTGSTTGGEFIEVRRKTGDSTWGDFDPQRMHLQFFGDRL